MKKFKITNYEITSEKISQELRFVMISDWHNVIFGERNKPVFEAIQKINPECHFNCRRFGTWKTGSTAFAGIRKFKRTDKDCTGILCTRKS